ncbi:MAG: hypothetical protein MZV65_25805, partial [Chromatiales bacterium]|nr:hypothetical protein [Chromatiales bacterium]
MPPRARRRFPGPGRRGRALGERRHAAVRPAGRNGQGRAAVLAGRLDRDGTGAGPHGHVPDHRADQRHEPEAGVRQAAAAQPGGLEPGHRRQRREEPLARGQLVAQSGRGLEGAILAATFVQAAGALDALYAGAAYDDQLGLTYTSGAPSLAVWAPTALGNPGVSVNLYDDPADT